MYSIKNIYDILLLTGKPIPQHISNPVLMVQVV